MYQIVQAPSEILRVATKPVSLPAGKLVRLIEEMKKILVSQADPEGVGLAANQISLPYRLFVARFGTKKSDPVYAFVNPEILEHSEELQPRLAGGQAEVDKKSPLEGCLSLPKYYGVVKRYLWIKLRYQTLTKNCELQTTDSRFEGFPAMVIQHEMDHLNGKIFVERILEQKGKLYKIVGKDKNGKDSWEEIEL